MHMDEGKYCVVCLALPFTLPETALAPQSAIAVCYDAAALSLHSRQRLLQPASLLDFLTLAQLGARISSYTFGAPHTGDAAFVTWLERQPNLGVSSRGHPLAVCSIVEQA